MSGEPNPHSREHIKSVFLCAPLYIAVQRCSSKFEISQKAAILRLTAEGAHALGFLSDEECKLLVSRYERKLVDVVAEKQGRKESSHVPVLTIEKDKAKRRVRDYSELSLEDLQREYDSAHASTDTVAVQMLRHEAKKRGFQLRGEGGAI